MNPLLPTALKIDLEAACNPLGIPPLLWAITLLGALYFSYSLGKQLLKNQKGPYKKPALLIPLIPIGLLLPAFALLHSHKTQKDVQQLTTLLQSPRRLLVTKVYSNPPSKEKKYFIEEAPIETIKKIHNKTIIQNTSFTPKPIPKKLIRILKEHNSPLL